MGIGMPAQRLSETGATGGGDRSPVMRRSVGDRQRAQSWVPSDPMLPVGLVLPRDAGRER
jgi:hypothetical protein